MGELDYLNLLEKILNEGEIRRTRNAETVSLFGATLEFDIRTSFPLLTTKRVYWKGVLGELLWFISGNTDAKKLSDEGIHIWDGNTSREYLDSVGLSHYQEGDGGPIYGYQWRHFGVPYVGCNAVMPSISGPRDQLKTCIDLIRTDPTSRRIFMSSWNPTQVTEMCLPPCHVSYQFYVNNMDELSCSMYMRSGDMFLGIPFNIASTAALVYILSHLTHKKPGKIIINIGDAHIYRDHIEQVNIQLLRKSNIYPFPTLTVMDTGQTCVEDYMYTDFCLEGYTCHPRIVANMVA